MAMDLDLSIIVLEVLSHAFLSRIYLSIFPVLKLSIAAGKGSFSSDIKLFLVNFSACETNTKVVIAFEVCWAVVEGASYATSFILIAASRLVNRSVIRRETIRAVYDCYINYIVYNEADWIVIYHTTASRKRKTNRESTIRIQYASHCDGSQ